MMPPNGSIQILCGVEETNQLPVCAAPITWLPKQTPGVLTTASILVKYGIAHSLVISTE